MTLNPVEQIFFVGLLLAPLAATGAPASDLTPGQQLTRDQEGEKLKSYHPTPGSGVTVGVGYDMRERKGPAIVADMLAAGVPQATADALAGAAGLSRAEADAFVAGHAQLAITADQSRALFVAVYDAMAATTKRVVTKDFSEVDWGKLNSNIKHVLIDMTFRGDNTPAVRKHLRQSVEANDRAAFKVAVSDKSIFPANLSQRRFKARVDHL